MSEPIESRSRARCLVVEDDLAVGREAVSVLEQRGCEAIHVTSVAAARAALAVGEWAALLTDVGLPDGSGLELARTARAKDEWLPILVFTGRGDPQHANEAQLVGAEFVFKPVTAESIAAFVQRVLARRERPGLFVERAAHALADDAGLTRAERQVLLEAARSPLREDLAERLGVSKNTLKSHVRHLLGKTGHDSLASAVRAVLERALAGG